MQDQLVTFSLVLMLTMLVNSDSKSQGLGLDTSSLPAYKNAVTFYNKTLKEELHLFNGKEDKGYAYQFTEGTPYFLTNKWSKGSLNYNGEIYEDVSLLYDAARDELVYLYFDNASAIRLIKDKVSGFSVMGHHFIHITPDSLHSSSIAPGFYDELYNGNNKLIAKRTKNIQTNIRQSGAEMKVFYKDHYYLRKSDKYYPVNNKRSFLSNLSDKKKELQQYIRQNRLNFKKDIENAMTKTLAYYDQLIK